MVNSYNSLKGVIREIIKGTTIDHRASLAPGTPGSRADTKGHGLNLVDHRDQKARASVCHADY